MTDSEKKEEQGYVKKKKVFEIAEHSRMQYTNDAMYCNEYFV